MTHHSDLQTVRQRVRNWLRARFPSFSAEEVSESILLQGARIVGHQFRCRNAALRWLSAEQRIDVLLNDQLVQSIDLADPGNLEAAA